MRFVSPTNIEQVPKTLQHVGGSLLSMDSFLRMKLKEQDEGLRKLKSAFCELVKDFLQVKREVAGVKCVFGALVSDFFEVKEEV